MLDLCRFLSSSFIAACPERVEGKQSPPWQEGDRHAEKAPARDDVKVSFLVGSFTAEAVSALARGRLPHSAVLRSQ